jgi:alkanesulfonate monooxygenase SsuD/methylene tetrahydromethanopterin reductase-like flavin-dependent oxidoreductase (luciferase family)
MATHPSALAHLLNRPSDLLGEQVLVGPPEDCAARLRAYERAGIDNVFVWPLADAETQLDRVMHDVAPLV